MNTAATTYQEVQDYYGKTLRSSDDLQTNACCTAEVFPAHLKPILKQIHPEILDRFYGCGSPIPLGLEGMTVLDLGCGTGRDVYLLSALVGESGSVIGVDMTSEQIEIAKKHQAYQADQFGHSKPNTTFFQGYMETLDTLGIETNSVDCVVSNCVLNLSPHKEKVFSEIFRVLKPGGELYFSDVFSSRRIPAELAKDPVLVGECLGGALYVEDFRRLLLSLGVNDYRVVSQAPITINNADIEAKLGMVDFYSLTIRAFKLDLEDRCEDFGQVAYYNGTIAEAPHRFALDDHHVFETGKPMLVCSNTAAMLQNTRFNAHFRVTGDTNTHLGLFDCGPDLAKTEDGLGGCC